MWTKGDFVIYRSVGLLILDNLGHELTFAYQLFADKGASFHHGTSATQFGHKRHVENECVAGNNFLTEFDIVNLHKVCRVTLGVGNLGQDKHTAGLGHSLDKEDAGHDGLLGK